MYLKEQQHYQNQHAIIVVFFFFLFYNCSFLHALNSCVQMRWSMVKLNIHIYIYIIQIIHYNLYLKLTSLIFLKTILHVRNKIKSCMFLVQRGHVWLREASHRQNIFLESFVAHLNTFLVWNVEFKDPFKTFSLY